MRAGEDHRALVEAVLDEVLPALGERPTVLSEAMRYAVGAPGEGGKRIRPLVCLYSSLAVGGTLEDAKYPAAAIEILHNYTLVHDDLPAMDNDVERRGRPTVWKKFGEANAILAGDALLALAYRVAAKAPRNVAAIIDVLGEKGVGVVRGQVEDVQGLRFEVPSSRFEVPGSRFEVRGSRFEVPGSRFEVPGSNPELETSNIELQTPFVYVHKTSDLFIAAAQMGGLAGGGSADDVAALGKFALNLGLAFQYEDDLLDGDGIYDRGKTAALAASTTEAAIAALEGLSGDTAPLKTLAAKLLYRKI